MTYNIAAPGGITNFGTVSLTVRVSLGAGIASDYLAGAAQHARTCARRHGNMAAAWALLGDALLEHHAVTPPSPAGTEPLQQCEAF